MPGTAPTIGSIFKLTEFSFVWTLPNFIDLVEKAYFKITSPYFQFGRVTWMLAFIVKDIDLDGPFVSLICFDSFFLELSNIQAYRLRIIDVEGLDYWLSPPLTKFTDQNPVASTHKVCNSNIFQDMDRVAPKGVLSIHLIFIPKGRHLFGTGQKLTAKSIGTQTKETSQSDQNCSLSGEGIDVLRQNIKNLLITGKDSDVVLNVKGKKFSAHQLILKCQSTVFDSMFEHEMLEKTSGVVDITDCNPDVFNDFLLYLYSGEMAGITCDSVVDLHYISHKYSVPEVTTACVKFMIENLTVETFCDFIGVGLQFDDVALIESANEFFAQNFKQVFVTEKWKKFLIENPNEGYTLMNTAFSKNEVLPVASQ